MPRSTIWYLVFITNLANLKIASLVYQDQQPCISHVHNSGKYRIITAVLKVETYIVTSISASLIGRAVILVIMYVETFKTDVIIVIGDIIMCLTSH